MKERLGASMLRVRRMVAKEVRQLLRDPKTGVYSGASDPRKDGQAAGW